MESLRRAIIEFTRERDWGQFHSPANLAKSIAIESGELLECFQWNNDFKVEDVSSELADVVNYAVLLADKLDINLEEAVMKKLRESAIKYPIDKAKGNSRKYTEF